MTIHSSDRWNEIESILDEVLDGTAEDRATLLDRCCAGDSELRRLVKQYLEAIEHSSPLDASLAEAAGDLAASMPELGSRGPLSPGERVGVYEIEGLLGEGGMGAVYLAHRADGQYDQQVAVKILMHRGFDDSARRRFLRERQILATLHHDNVARLIDGGVTDAGIPFLVLEYIDGPPITDHCRQRGLSRERRLRLFLQACYGVHHAHRNGVIHRDVKPSNILVESAPEGDEKVLVLDFGIAAVSSDDDLTLTGQVMGTPGYGAPEQIRGHHAEVDRRSDVYSLGVVLYELLVDRRPFAGSSPSEVLLAMMEGSIEAPRSVRPDLPADLDTIVTTCLELDPTRRYPSVRALSDDIERYLDGREIKARPVHPVQRIMRRARRHPAVTAIAGAGALAVIASALMLAIGGVRYARGLERERSLAVTARNDAEDLLEFMLKDLHRGLQPLGRLDLLDQVARKALAYYENRPLTNLHGDALQRRGLALLNVGLVLEAQAHRDEALSAYRQYRRVAEQLTSESTDPRWQLELAWSLHAISDVMAARGDTADALIRIHEALALSAPLGEALADDPAWQQRQFKILAAAGWLERESGRLEAAASLLDRALQLARQCGTTGGDRREWMHREAVALSYLGLVHQEGGELDRAIRSFFSARDLCQELVTSDPDNVTWLEEMQLVNSRLGTALLDHGDPRAALPPLERSLDTARALVDLEPDNATWQRELNVAHATIAWCQRELQDLTAARHHLEQALAISSAAAESQPGNPSAANDLAWDLLELGRVERDRGHPEAAEPLFERAVEVMRQATSAHSELFYLDTLFQALIELGRRDEASRLAGELAGRGWQSADFLALCRTHHITSTDG